MKPKDVVKMMLQPDARQALDGALGVRAFRHVFEEGGLDLVAEFLLDLLAAQVVLLGPAAIADLGADIDEAGLDLVLRRQPARRARSGDGRGKSKNSLFHLDSSSLD